MLKVYNVIISAYSELLFIHILKCMKNILWLLLLYLFIPLYKIDFHLKISVLPKELASVLLLRWSAGDNTFRHMCVCPHLYLALNPHTVLSIELWVVSFLSVLYRFCSTLSLSLFTMKNMSFFVLHIRNLLFDCF